MKKSDKRIWQFWNYVDIHISENPREASWQTFCEKPIQRRRLEIKMNKNVDNKKPQRNHKIKTLETSDLMYFACVSHSQDVNFLLPPHYPLLPTVHRIPCLSMQKNSALQQFVSGQCHFSSVRCLISPKIKNLNSGDWTPVQLQRVLGREKIESDRRWSERNLPEIVRRRN